MLTFPDQLQPEGWTLIEKDTRDFEGEFEGYPFRIEYEVEGEPEEWEMWIGALSRDVPPEVVKRAREWFLHFWIGVIQDA